jgi:serine/threonine-protein kinase HipA
MADECGFNRTMILRRVENLAEKARRKIPEAVETVKAMPGGGHPLLGDFAAAIETRCRAVVRNLAHVEGGVEDAEPEPAQTCSVIPSP